MFIYNLREILSVNVHKLRHAIAVHVHDILRTIVRIRVMMSQV